MSYINLRFTYLQTMFNNHLVFMYLTLTELLLLLHVLGPLQWLCRVMFSLDQTESSFAFICRFWDL